MKENGFNWFLLFSILMCFALVGVFRGCQLDRIEKGVQEIKASH